MFPSSSLFSLPSALPLSQSSSSLVAPIIQPIQIHDIETQHHQEAKTLKQLLKLNHANHSILSNQYQSPNDITHILGSAFILGVKKSHLLKVYDKLSKYLEEWIDSPEEISKHDWRDHLGDQRYQRAYVDFFDDEFVLNGYDWKKVLDRYMFEGKEPLINGIFADWGHPLVHLGYAYELSSRELAIEALGLAATCYGSLHKYIDNTDYTKASSYSSSSPLRVLEVVAADNRLDSLPVHSSENIEIILREKEDVILEHWNAWDMSNPKKQLEDSQYTAVALFATVRAQGSNKYEFLLTKLLIISHAVRTILPLIPAKFHASLIRQWWLLTLVTYISHNRPPVYPQLIINYDIMGKDWNWVREQAVESRWANDVHYVKGLRALQAAGQTWPDLNQFYLRAAVRFGSEFKGWSDIKGSSSLSSCVGIQQDSVI